jgi:hypothetical protein
MKGRILVMAGLLAITGHGRSATIGLWTFNSTPPDGSTATGSLLPSVGAGVATMVGGISGSFAAGTGADPGPDNTGWSTSGYPAAAAGNKTAGVEFRVSTRGYTNVAISWEQRASGSASRYSRLQYSVNGLEFVDASPVIQLSSNNTYYAQSIALAALPGVDDNPSFAFRIVAEFESTATGIGAAGYVTPLGANYSGSGTVRYDLVQIVGDPLRPDNTPPTIEPIPDMVTVENGSITGYPVVVGDDATPASAIGLRAMSSNTNLIPVEQITLTGDGANRQLSIVPRIGLYGDAIITLVASDAENLTASVSFKVTVSPLNAPPTLAPITLQRQVQGDVGEVAITVGDLETAVDALTVAAACSNGELVGPTGLEITGSGANRVLRIQPVAGVTGTAVITVRVDDGGGRSTSTSFPLMVVPTAGAGVWETFDYPNGSLVTNSAGLWLTHGGTTGQVQVVDSGVVLGGSRTEDLHILVPSGAGNTGAIFVAFTVRFSALPADFEYFAHLNHGSSFRARLYAGTNGAASGSFRLAIGNGGAAGLGVVPSDLQLETTYTVVMRYHAATATGSLWVNPESETDAAAVATDTATAVTIQSFSFRNNAGIGTMRVEDLRMGASFSDVLIATGWGLSIAKTEGMLEVSWPATAVGYRLQSNSTPTQEGWLDEPTVPVVVGDRAIVRLPTSDAQRFFRLKGSP